MCRSISAQRDVTTRQVISEVLTQWSETPLPKWCWLTLGSDGRCEQTLLGDQDNAIVFDGPGDKHRREFMRLARQINERLAELGAPLCPGKVMAMNEKWCRSIDEWHEAAIQWLRTPNPEQLLEACIFLDFRGVAGEIVFAQDLRQWLRHQIRQQPYFIRTLAQDAIRDDFATPALGMIGVHISRALRRHGLSGSWFADIAIDTKAFGVSAAMCFVRVLALSRGIEATSTDERLVQLAKIGAMTQRDSDQLRAAFDRMQHYRLRAQLEFCDAQPGGLEAVIASAPPPVVNVLGLENLKIEEIKELYGAMKTLKRLRRRVELEFLR